jgi:leucyl aminopeptidase
MEITLTQGNLYKADVDTLILFLFEDTQAEDATKSLKTALTTLTASGDFTGKANQTSVIYPGKDHPAQRVIVVGLGAADAFTPEVARRAAAHAAKKAKELKAEALAAALPANSDGASTTYEALAEGALLALYQYHGQKTQDAPQTPQSLQIYLAEGHDQAAAEQGIAAAISIAQGVTRTRDLVNLPPNICTPKYLAKVASQIAKETGLKATALNEKKMEELGMGALLGVSQGSETPARFIIMEHNADKAEELETIVLVGKGVTFDTGGYSLKPGDSMFGMKADMGGGAAVIGAMEAIAKLDLPLHVVGLIPAADNMVSGNAYRPQEVLTASNGVTIEIVSTDAEGRLLLADALVYASRYNPAAVVDIATLTGACVVALGSAAAGLFANNDALQDSLMAAASNTQEKLWPLPMYDEYEKSIESQTADIKNSAGRMSGVGSAAVFLRHFVDYPAWAHLDIAGVAGIDGMTNSSDMPYVPAKGATGFGVRLMTDFVRNWANKA